MSQISLFDEKLMACPFCGRIPKIVKEFYPNFDVRPVYWIRCKCGVCADEKYSAGECIDFWNKRVF